jgi:DNA helicase-2/ATP-dependent DNA helicase PcrA
VRLEQNYRSVKAVLESANAVIAQNPNRKAKRMWTDGAMGDRVKVIVAPTEEEEARFVAREIQKHVAQGVPADEIAVLYRTNGQSRPVEEALREKEVPYEVIGGSEFFDRREVKDVIAYFKAIANPLDEVSLLRIINVPTRGIGDVTVERLSAHARREGWSLQDALARSAEIPDLPQGSAECVAAFHRLLERYRAMYEKAGLAESTRLLLDEVGFKEAARQLTRSAAVADRKLQSVEGILGSLDAYEKREGPKANLLSYVNRLSLDFKDAEDNPTHTARRVTLMTLHAAKGLEYKVVFLIGMEEDLMPHSGMQGEAQNLEEERRLCYVGMTRARERLYLSRAAMRVKRGKELPRTPSRFLADLPPELFEVQDIGAPPPGPPTEQEQRFFANLKERLLKKAAGSAAGS